MPAMAEFGELAGHVLGGKYRLIRAVSEGPRPVYEARHDRLGGRFAVKMWPATTPWEAFRRGAEVAVTLRHPGVMQVIDFNCEPGASPFLVLEWIDGQRLSQLLVESGLLPIERVAPLVESAAWALAAAHQQGVVHQELRPDEVFVVHAPGTMREWVKIAGFGVSSALARAGAPRRSRYRAPEQQGGGDQAQPDDGDDPQSDQYALAAIAYEMLAGVPPVDETRPEPLPISDLAPGVTAAVDAAIRQALANEPEQRFAGVLEFARALRDAVEGASPEALRRRAAGGTSPERRGRRESVSPFFNPLQGRASEVLRRVVSTTARLRTLARPSLLRFPMGPAARIAVAGVALLVAVSGTALVVRRRPPPRGAPLAPAPIAARPAPAAQPTTAPPPPSPGAAAATAPIAVAEKPPADDTSADDAAAARQARTAAWARLGAGGTHVAASPKAKVAKAKGLTPKPAPPPPALAATKLPAKDSTKDSTKDSSKAPTKDPFAAKATPSATAGAKGPEAGACVMTVGSRPPADVWLDDRSLGRRTPLVSFRTACGDHKLALKRTDLDLYQMEVVTLRAGKPFKKVYPLQ
jgi:serine/threonine-protein kinase